MSSPNVFSPGSSVQAWLTENRGALEPFLATPGESLVQRIDRSLALYSQLAAAGVSLHGWPEDLGGTGGTARDRAELYDALAASGFDMPEQVAALEVLGPALVEFAPELAVRHLPQILGGNAVWCQGFSEPEAGSDLASLRTTAVRDGDGWRITGQKVWTSLAHHANWCAVLARTGAKDSRHRGLTLFWVDLSAAGVSVRPLDTLTGEPEFSEVFFDSVFVSHDAIVGEVDGGWAVAMYLLQYERGMWAWQRQARMHAMLNHLVAENTDVIAAHRAQLGAAFASLAALRLRSRMTVDRLANGEVLGPEVSVDKILLSTTERLVNDAISVITRSSFLFGDAPHDAATRSEWFYSRAASIYGGAVEIQKGILADRVLQLPKEASRG